MSDWVNVGALDNSVPADIPTKAALKRQIGQNPTNVVLYATDAIGPNRNKSYTVDELPIGYKFSVAGPNPYTSRKWFATVEKLPNGTITVK